MKTDRELLELAAKASGRRLVGWNEHHGVEVAVMEDGSYWQPLLENDLTDCMGDALRLAVVLKISMRIETLPHAQAVVAYSYFQTSRETLYDVRLKSLIGTEAATRRAIVRTAAEIGESMP